MVRDFVSERLVLVGLVIAVLYCEGCARTVRSPSSTNCRDANVEDEKPVEDHVIRLPMDASVFEPIRIGLKMPDLGPSTLIENPGNIIDLYSSSQFYNVQYVHLPNGVHASALVDDAEIVRCIRVWYPIFVFDGLGPRRSTYEEILTRFPSAKSYCMNGFATVLEVKPGVRFCFFPWTQHLNADAKPMWIDFMAK
jgi:hypothetical protein